MRLIDADALERTLVEAQAECKKNGGNFRFGVFSNVRANVADAPTIDAIPEEWILNKVGDEETYTLKYRHAWSQLVGLWAKEQEAR